MAAKGLLAVLGVALPALFAFSTAHCPAPEYVNPLGCTCAHETALSCSGIKEEQHLRRIMAACDGYRLEAFGLINASLDWLPEDLFDSINTMTFVLERSTLKSLTKPQTTGSRLFAGSGIVNVLIAYTDLQDGDLTHLRDLDELERLMIIGHQTVHLESLTQILENTNLKMLRLSDIPNLVWKTGALDALNKLDSLWLMNLGLGELSRNDLPEHAEGIDSLRLQMNKLTRIPPDFLDGMHKLQLLDLSDNQIVTLEEETFSNFNGLIGLYGNPLRCDSKLDWLRRRLLEGSLQLIYGNPTTCDDGSPFVPE